MRHTPTKPFRPAIAMIELIFAIVVMGIVMMSAPMLLNQARQSSYQGLNQEAIAAVAAQASMIFTYQWDENDTNQSLGAPILEVSNAGDPELREVGITGVRIGMEAGGSTRSFRIDTGGRHAALTALGLDNGESIANMDTLDDIDDFNGQVITLTPVGGLPNANGDYVDRQIQILANVTYVRDRRNYARRVINNINLPLSLRARTTNIKAFSVQLSTTLTDADLRKNITLQGFSCNIGTYRNLLRIF